MKLRVKKYAQLVLILFLFSNFSFTQNDCVDAIIACGNSDISLDVNGSGIREFDNSCQSNENNSVWLQVTLVTSGTLGFTLTPNSTAITEDYDFFVFGPNVSCGNVGSTIRCSTTNPQAANQGNNLTGMNATSTDTSEGPGAAGDSFVRWLDVQAGESYFIVIDRPIGNSPFSLEWTGTATFSEPPTDEASTSGTALNFEQCDVMMPFSDGFTTFNISDNTAPITGMQSDVIVTYHETASDANIGINPLTSPYTNITNPQTIYTRITNTTTGCFELTDFDLNVNIGPDFTIPSDFVLCDNLDDGDDKNGRVIFDLPSKNNEILDGQNPSGFNVLYYASRTDAENRTGIPLPNLYYNITSFNEEIFVRIEDVLNPDCKSITSLNLITNIVPDAFNHNILQCDEDGNIDGFTLFNLNEANNILTGALPNRSTKFYTDNARTQEIDGRSFANTTNTQIIYVEVINDDTGCISNSELTLEVSVTDSNDSLLSFCDDDGQEDGFYEFTLSNANIGITNGLPAGLNISYYETYNDALLEVNDLGTNYTNTTAYNQIIYARVENDNNCYGISEVTLTVFALPNITAEDLVYYCLNNFPDNIPINAALLNDSPNNYSYNWSTGENTYEIQINTTGIYTVKVTDNSNNCSKDRTIIVEASNIATFNLPPFDIKDASPNNSVTVLVSGEGIYQFSLTDENGNIIKPYQDSNIFENVSPGIYTVAVRDIKNDCGTIQENVSVIGFPKFFTPNNDGFNDTWQVSGISSMFQPESKILIFNRFGKLIKEINPLGAGWDGLFNGEKLPSDDYWFSIKLQDGRLFKNHFTLKY